MNRYRWATSCDTYYYYLAAVELGRELLQNGGEHHIFVDNDTHKNTITMLICCKLQNINKNNKLKMSEEDLNKKTKNKNKI
jgi:hypothetical protein